MPSLDRKRPHPATKSGVFLSGAGRAITNTLTKGKLSLCRQLADADGMSHRYRLGDLVAVHTPSVPPGPYRIVRLLPPVAGEPHYHGQSMGDGHHRALTEGQLRPVVKPKPVEVVDQGKERKRAGR